MRRARRSLGVASVGPVADESGPDTFLKRVFPFLGAVLSAKKQELVLTPCRLLSQDDQWLKDCLELAHREEVSRRRYGTLRQTRSGR